MKLGTKLLLVLFIISAGYLKGQVTIGSDIPPEDAALLDVKSRQPRTDGGETTDGNGGGILLPRVNLVDINKLSPFIDRATESQKKRHTGLVVYNLTKSSVFDPGMYIWDGSKWRLLGDKEGNNWSLTGNTNTLSTDYVGTSDAQHLIIKTSDTERIRITADGKIGINTDDPQEQLEVTGDTRLNNEVFLGNTPKAPSSDVVSQLVRDNSTGQVYYIKSSTGNTFTFNYLSYSLSNLESGDWVENLDTQISAADYTLIVVGSNFETKPIDAGLKVSPSGLGVGATYSPQSVFAYPDSEGKTWRLRADFVGGEPAIDKSSGTWHIQCIAINNSVVKAIPRIEHDMGGNRVSTATRPSGL